jgi:ribulose-5-phosphate 4-epimerase/fuculose-1-phosphate aldolase
MFAQLTGSSVNAMAITDTRTSMIDGIELTPQHVAITLPPEFATVEEERAHRRHKLAGALRIFGRLGFGEGVAGHITVRDPEHTDHFWVNPFGMSFRHVRASDLILVNHIGEVVYGKHPVNRAAFVIHAAIHKARPDIVAAAHSHSPYGKSFSSLGIPLAPLTQDACIFYEDHVVIAEQGGAVVLEVEAGEELASRFPTGKAAIHKNHGLFTVGETVDEAAFWFITMERSCQAQLMAMAAGTPEPIRHEFAKYTAAQIGFPLAGWFSFQPLWQEICRTDPEIFD